MIDLQSAYGVTTAPDPLSSSFGGEGELRVLSDIIAKYADLIKDRDALIARLSMENARLQGIIAQSGTPDPINFGTNTFDGPFGDTHHKDLALISSHLERLRSQKSSGGTKVRHGVG